jgi:hypothetical protein
MSETMTVHKLKTWPPYFEAVERGEKNFEVRRDDRGFQKGDYLELIFHSPDEQWRKREPIHKRITWILTGGQFGIEPGYVVLGLGEVDSPADREGK